MKNTFLGLLSLSLLIELVLTLLCFFMPAMAMELFGMQYNVQTAFLGYIIAWFCLLVSVFILYCLYLLYTNNVQYKPIIYLLSFWWVGLGLGVYMVFGKIDNLLLDSLKGALLLLLNYKYKIKNAK